MLLRSLRCPLERVSDADIANRVVRDAEPLGENTRRERATAHHSRLLIRQLRSSVPLPRRNIPCPTPFALSIFHVIEIRAEEEVTWTNATGVVALVEDVKPFGNLSSV